MPKSDTWFKPGQSGNPSGRTRRKPVTDELRKLLRAPADGSQFTNAHMVAWRIIQAAKTGDMTAARLLLEYVEGKPVQPVTLDLGPLVARLAQEHGLSPTEAEAAALEADRYLAELNRARVG